MAIVKYVTVVIHLDNYWSMAMKSARIDSDQRQLLRQILEEAYRLPTWNGTNLRASLRRVPAEAAGWRPPKSRRSIADIVVHCAYWKYALRRRLSNGKRGAFPFKGSNWFRLPSPVSRPQWSEYLTLLDDQHQQLCDFLAEDSGLLSYSDSATHDQTCRIYGLAIHDAYHTGQVHLIKKLWIRSNHRPLRR